MRLPCDGVHHYLLTAVLAAMLALPSLAAAGDLCPYDATGDYTYDPATKDSYQFFGDGQITYDWSREWYMDDTMACFNVLRNKKLLKYFPKCDINGDGRVTIIEVSDIYFRVHPVGQEHGVAQNACVEAFEGGHHFFCPPRRYKATNKAIDAILAKYPATGAIVDPVSDGLGQQSARYSYNEIDCKVTEKMPADAFDSLNECYLGQLVRKADSAALKVVFAETINTANVVEAYDALARRYGGSCERVVAAEYDAAPGFHFKKYNRRGWWLWDVVATAQCDAGVCACDMRYNLWTHPFVPGQVWLKEEVNRSSASCTDTRFPGATGCPDADEDFVCDADDQCPGEDDRLDTDGDGALDCLEECDADAGKTEPGICGCGVADVDTDADGTLDCEELCPMDALKTDPGACGCGVEDIDSDGDGVLDCLESCDQDPGKTDPGVCGCGVADTDIDGDGILDCQDACPTDPANTCNDPCYPHGDDDGDGVCNNVDVCPGADDNLDSDSDGFADCLEECDNDPMKQTAGLCGCGVSDVDTDGDGTPDCNDQCPADGGKVLPGTCGCGVSDVDTDNDGTPDCNDQCPSDANKTAPGTCGCNVADVDSDGDGILDCNDSCPNDATNQCQDPCYPDGDDDGDTICNAQDQCPGENDLLDTDGDGAVDCLEECDTDANKVAVGTCGCGVADTDTDNDGTADCNDQCATDPNKTDPGTCGCGVSDVDSDNDGTPDCNDECVTDPNKTAEGVCGCGIADIDSDGDDAFDCNDQCINDPNKTAPGACGCGNADVDTDGDGAYDCNDQCINDPNKTVPGVCGCDVADTDTDGDGYADCQEDCDNDPDKQTAGVCGCNVSDVDTDNDGTPDCNDQCELDPNKTAPGTCGCGAADVDSDDDGILDCNDTCPTDPTNTCTDPCFGHGGDTDGDTVCDDVDQCPGENDLVDSDGDGAVDCLEECDYDPNKQSAGVCGCGIADDDTDSDGILDCNDTCPADPTNTCNDPCFGQGGDSDGDTVCDDVDQCPGENDLLDTDTDGTADCLEQCDNDPDKTIPGVCGCGVEDLDTDGDGTYDCDEQCINDPDKQEPGICGCGVEDLDTDGDGTYDCHEQCINDPDKQDPGVCGCGVADDDTDDDGALDCNEECDDDPAKTVPGTCGCGVADDDTDDDGFADCEEECVNDPAKQDAGVCGCGTPDLDSDTDGAYDCIEECDNDPDKTTPGVCGCDVADDDTDGDGTYDCNDLCPNDGAKTDPGQCGCGVADTDTDGDTVADCNDVCPDGDDLVDADANGIPDDCDASGPTCDDLAGTNWGPPAMPLGAAVINGTCSMIFGSSVPAGIEIWDNVNECIANCEGCATNDDCDSGEYCKYEDYTCGPVGEGICEPRGEICTAQYDPVCSCDYTIVSNACMAGVQGESIMSDGECAPEDVCNHNGGTWTGTECDCPPGTWDTTQRGCEPCTADTDGDGVCDIEDVCPGADDATAPDADGDGVCDLIDACPGEDDTLDTDSDGVADCLDPCPQDNPDDPDDDGECGVMGLTMIEDFEADPATWPWAPWESPQAIDFSLVDAVAAHDGAQGLQLGEWHYRTDTTFGTEEDQVLSIWCYAGDNQGCRLGFGTDATGRFEFRLITNDNRILLADSHGEQDPWTFNPPLMASTYTSTDILPSAWYKMEVHLLAGGEVDAQLWSSGGAPIASVQYHFGAFPATGIALYGGMDHYVDTIEVGPSSGACIDMDQDGSCDADDLCIGNDAEGDDDGDGICNDNDICIGVDLLGDVNPADGVCDTATCDPATPAFYDQTGSPLEWAAGGVCVETIGIAGAPACTQTQWQRYVDDISLIMTYDDPTNPDGIADYDFTNATWDGATTSGQLFSKGPYKLLCHIPGGDYTVQPLFDDLNGCYHASSTWMSAFTLALINFDWGVNVWSLIDDYNARAALMNGTCEFNNVVGAATGFHGVISSGQWVDWSAQGTNDCDYYGCRCDAVVTGFSDGTGTWFLGGVTNSSGPRGLAGQETDCTDPRFAF